MSSFPSNPSQSFIKRNPHLYGNSAAPAAPSKMLRQSSKPLLNNLEQEYFDILNAQFPNYPRPRAQAVRVRLCNGLVYTPDLFSFSWPIDNAPSGPVAWEIKGKHVWDDAIVKLKVAAKEYPEIVWILCWKENGEWKTQTVMP